MNKFGVIVSGFGGQGILFVGYLLAHAAMYEGKNVACVPSYGAEMRGGTAHCSVLIDHREIYSPIVEQPDILMAFNRPSVVKFEPRVSPRGLMLLNSSMVDHSFGCREDIRIIKIAANLEAQKLGDSRVANLIMLGGLIKATGIISLDSARAALETLLPDHRRNVLAINCAALKTGASMVWH